MKKLLLTLAAVLAIGFAALAEEVIYTCNVLGGTNIQHLNQVTINDALSFAFARGIGSDANTTHPAYNNKGDIRLYSKATATLTGTNVIIEKVVFNLSKQGKSRLAEITASNGVIADQNKGDATVTWTGNSNSVVFTVGLKAIYGGDGANFAGQLCFDKVTITYSSATPAEPQDPELSFDMKGQDHYEVYNTEYNLPTLNNPHNLDITWKESTYPNVATIDPSTGKVTIVGKGLTNIRAEFAGNAQYKAGYALYTLWVVDSYNTVEDFLYHEGRNEGFFNFDLTVAYVNGDYTYVTTGDEWAVIMKEELSYSAGDVIPSGWYGVRHIRNGLPIIRPANHDMPAASATGKPVSFSEVSEVDLAMVNKIVVLKGVTFDASTPSETDVFGNLDFAGTVGGSTYTFRPIFGGVESVAAGTYDVTCAVGYYKRDQVPGGQEIVKPTVKENMRLYPISYKVNTVGIEAIEAAGNAAVEYFNLQGVRVAKPEGGLFIRRQGSKVTKVVIE